MWFTHTRGVLLKTIRLSQMRVSSVNVSILLPYERVVCYINDRSVMFTKSNLATRLQILINLFLGNHC